VAEDTGASLRYVNVTVARTERSGRKSREPEHYNEELF
jgi:hypothetical protein